MQTDACSNSLKIVIITSFAPFRGSETYTIHEALALIDNGVNVVVIPRTASGAIIGTAAKKLLANTLCVPFISTAIAYNTLRATITKPTLVAKAIAWTLQHSDSLYDFVKGLLVLPKSFYLAELLKHERLTHILAHSTTTVTIIGYVLSEILHVPWSAVLHDSSPVRQKHQRSLQAILHSAQFIRSIDQRGVEKLQELFSEQHVSKFYCVYEGVDVEVNRTHSSKPKEVISIATVAYLIKKKGHDYALEAAKLLKERGIVNFVWNFYGDGPEREHLVHRITELGLDGLIELKGWIPNDQLMELYSSDQVDILALPSITDNNGCYEGIPHSLKEAMSYGIPVIATDTGGTQELVGNGAGLLIREKDARALADAIERLVSVPRNLEDQGAKGQTRVRELFDSKKNVKHLINIICKGT